MPKVTQLVNDSDLDGTPILLSAPGLLGKKSNVAELMRKGQGRTSLRSGGEQSVSRTKRLGWGQPALQVPWPREVVLEATPHTY